MTTEEMNAFREEVADPVLRRFLDKVDLVEGTCLINHLDFQFPDGRNCGAETYFIAKGLIVRDGKVVEFESEAGDAVADETTVEEFLKSLDAAYFSMDGRVHIWDEIKELEITTTIRSAPNLDSMFNGLAVLKDVYNADVSSCCVKMEYIHNHEN